LHYASWTAFGGVRVFFMLNNCGVYKIVSPSNKIYIGSSIDLKTRLSKYKRGNCKSQRRLYASFLKYGIEAHKIEVIKTCEPKDLFYYESFYGNLYSCTGDNGLNCFIPNINDKFRTASEETRKKISEANKGEKHHMFGKTHSEKTKALMSKNNKSKKWSEEYRKRFMDNLKPYKHTEETKKRLSALAKNRKMSDETKRKVSESLKKNRNRKTEFTKGTCGYNSYVSKIILDVNTGVYYYSLSDLNTIQKVSRTVTDKAFKNKGHYLNHYIV
jgi:group I intron endonuclease